MGGLTPDPIGEVHDRQAEAVDKARSRSPAEYATQLEAHGPLLTTFVAEDPACEDLTVMMAQKIQGD